MLLDGEINVKSNQNIRKMNRNLQLKTLGRRKNEIEEDLTYIEKDHDT